MTVSALLTAERLLDLGVDFLIDRAIVTESCVLEPLEKLNGADEIIDVAIRHSRALRSFRPVTDKDVLAAEAALESQRTLEAVEALEAAYSAMVAEEIADQTFEWSTSIDQALSMRSAAFVDLLAFLRWGRRCAVEPNAQVPLPAPLPPQPGAPALFDGALEIVEVGTLIEAASVAGHVQLAAELDLRPGLRQQVRLRWMHRRNRFPQGALESGLVLESIHAESSERFWEAVSTLTHAPGATSAGLLSALMRTVDDVESQRFRERVEKDFALIEAHGVPLAWPAFAVGRDIFCGSDAVEELIAFLEGR